MLPAAGCAAPGAAPLSTRSSSLSTLSSSASVAPADVLRPPTQLHHVLIVIIIELIFALTVIKGLKILF